MVKGGFIVVEYSGWGESAYTEIVNEEDLRPKNTNPPIDANTFHKFEIPVPEELREEWVFYSTNSLTIKEKSLFLNSVGIQLILMKRKATILCEIHILLKNLVILSN